MARYFFHLTGPGKRIEDNVGVELTDLDSIRDECRRAIHSVLEEEASTEITQGHRFEITNEAGEIVIVVPIETSS